MAQPQQQRDVPQDQLCPPNKRFDLMDANKKFDLVNLQCPNESKILANILINHPLKFIVAGFALVPWIYMYQLWHTVKEDRSKYKLKFLLGTKELIMTVADFRQNFQLPQATENNYAGFVDATTFGQMVPFFRNILGFYLVLRSPSNFKSKGLSQPLQTLCKIFSRCLTTQVTGHDQPLIQIMQMLYCFINNVHVDYAELLWEGLHYSLMHPTTLIPYLRFTKIIVDHYMTEHLDISRRVHDNYHRVKKDDLVKNIFNFGKNKEGTGMKIPDWMLIDEMKQTDHYKMYDAIFRVDVPTTQSQPIESTQGTHRTTSAPRTPNSEVAEG
ncbi:hypothetical protein Tco_1237788 [Tanacetum coccineum]